MACSPGRSAPSTISATTTGARRTPASPATTSSATSRSSTRSPRPEPRSARLPPRLRWPGSSAVVTTSLPSRAPAASHGSRENTAAADIELTPVQLQRLDSLEPAAGERNDQANMRPERIRAAMRQGYAGSSVNYEIHHDDLPPTCQGAVRRDLVKSTSTCDQ